MVIHGDLLTAVLTTFMNSFYLLDDLYFGYDYH